MRHALKLVRKIVENPSEIKYRRLKTSSALFRERFANAGALLSAIGFTSKGDRLVAEEPIESEAIDLIEQRLDQGAASFGVEDDGMETDDEELARAIAMSTSANGAPRAAPVVARKWSEEDRKGFVQRRVGELFQEATSRGVAPNEAAAAALASAQKELSEKMLVEEEPPQREDKRFKRMEAPEKVEDTDIDTIEVLYEQEGIVFVDPSFPPTPSSVYGDEDPSTWRCAGCGGLNPISPEMNTRQGVLKILEDARRNRGSGNLSCKHCGRAQPALEVSMRPSGWLRPNDIRDDLTMQTSTVPWVVFREEPRPDDVRQGGLGNCWMVCALSVLAEVAPKLLRRCFELSPVYAPSGAYRVRLNSAGAWHTVTLDDSLPVTALDTAAYLKPARRSLWAPLLEKAAAKLHGSYAALQGGSFAEAFGMLTGYPVKRVVLGKFCVEFTGAAQRVYGSNGNKTDESSSSSEVDDSKRNAAAKSSFEDQDSATLELFALLYSYKEAKFAVGASTFVRADDAAWDAEMRSLGLQTRHAYGVLDAKQYQGEFLVKLRNPNGVALWTGEFSRSKCSREAVEALGLDNEDKGVFWMKCSDMAKYFVELTVCRLVPESYLEVRASGWLASRFGPGNAARIDVYSRSSVEISIYQEAHAERGESAVGTAVDLGLAVLKMEDSGVGASNGAPVLVASSRRVAHTAGAACDATLEQDATPTSYLVVPLCFGHVGSTEPRKFSCAVHSSSHALALETIPLDATMLAQAVVALAIKFGERQVLLKANNRLNSDALAFYVLQDEAGLCIVAENLAPFPLVAQLDAQTVRGFVSTRSENSTQDVLPPRSRMILAVLSKLPGYTQVKLEGLSYSAQMLPEDYVSDPETDHFPSLDHLDQLKPFHLPIPLPPATEDEEQISAAQMYQGNAGGGAPGSSSTSGSQIDAATLAGALRRAMGDGGGGGAS